MKLFSRISTFFVLVSLFVPALSFAQSSAKNLSGYMPQLYISKLALDKSDYSVGDTVNGSFEVQNYDQGDTPDLNYIVSLVGLDQSGSVARVVYDSEQNGPINLAGKSTKIFNFSYKIGSASNSDTLAIHVRIIMKDGASLAWKLVPLKISGGSSMFDATDAYLVNQNGQKFSLQEGPTIKAGDTLSFVASYQNSDTKAVILSPQVQLLDKAGQPISGQNVINEKNVSVSRSPVTIKLDLPTSDLRPDTYLAKISLFDNKGNVRGPDLFARYIISGDIVTIQSVYEDSPFPILKDSEANLSVNYSGKPLDTNNFSSSTTSATSTPVVADISVKLFNHNKQMVNESSLKEVTFNTSGTIKIPVTIDQDSNSLTAQITVSQDGNVLSSYEGNVVYDASKIFSTTSTKDRSTGWLLVVGYIAIILIIIIFIIFCIKKFKMSKDIGNLALMITISLGFLGLFGMTKAFVLTHEDSIYDSMPFLVSGVPPQTVSPGESFSVNVTFQEVACYNSGAIVDTATGLGAFLSDTSSNWSSATIDNVLSSSQQLQKLHFQPTVAVGPHQKYLTPYADATIATFRAPGNPGQYQINTKFVNTWNIENTGEMRYIGTLAGYWPITVTSNNNDSGSPSASSTTEDQTASSTCSVGDICFSQANYCGITYRGKITSCDPDGNPVCSATTPSASLCPNTDAKPLQSVPVGTIKIKSFYASPSTINPASSGITNSGVCTFKWDFNQYDGISKCEIFDPSGASVKTFTPSETNPPLSSYAVTNVNKETTYKLSCLESDAPTVISTKYATCYTNQNYTEVNN